MAREHSQTRCQSDVTEPSRFRIPLGPGAHPCATAIRAWVQDPAPMGLSLSPSCVRFIKRESSWKSADKGQAGTEQGAKTKCTGHDLAHDLARAQTRWAQQGEGTHG
jgi:hypothetical protein